MAKRRRQQPAGNGHIEPIPYAMTERLHTECVASGMDPGLHGRDAQNWLAKFFVFVFGGEPVDEFKPNRIPKHRRCPICWNGYGGRGLCKHTESSTQSAISIRYYRCDQCGHSWKQPVETRILQIDDRATDG